MHESEAPTLVGGYTVEQIVERKARIGKIDIDAENVFDTTKPDEDKAVYRFANHVHVKTQAHVLESTLLFGAGDLFDPRELEESARLLRSRGWIADAVVVPSRYDAESNTVDVLVTTRDSWSLSFDLSFGRSGGENDVGFGVEERNVLGSGIGLRLLHRSDVDRDRNVLGFSDESLFNSRVRLSAAYADSSDGSSRELVLGRPFFSMDTRWSVVSAMFDEQRIDQMYDLGEPVDQFGHSTRGATIESGWSRGLVDGKAKRWLVGFTSEEDRFSPTLEAPPTSLLPEDRKLVYPWVGFQLVEDDFRELTELNDMGRTEDVEVGLRLKASLGYSSKALGADRDAWLADVAVHKGWALRDDQLVLTDAVGSTRQEDSELTNVVVEGSARYYRKTLPRQLFLARLSATQTHGLDVDQQVLLGGDTGLRGYPIRYQSGTGRALLTLEERMFTDWYPLHLVRVGYAAFVDAGRTWGRDPRGTPGQGMLYDAGFGLRLSSPRASGRSIVHVDLAFPLNGDESISGVQVNIRTKGSF